MDGVWILGGEKTHTMSRDMKQQEIVVRSDWILGAKSLVGREAGPREGGTRMSCVM